HKLSSVRTSVHYWRNTLKPLHIGQRKFCVQVVVPEIVNPVLDIIQAVYFVMNLQVTVILSVYCHYAGEGTLCDNAILPSNRPDVFNCYIVQHNAAGASRNRAGL